MPHSEVKKYTQGRTYGIPVWGDVEPDSGEINDRARVDKFKYGFWIEYPPFGLIRKWQAVRKDCIDYFELCVSI